MTSRWFAGLEDLALPDSTVPVPSVPASPNPKGTTIETPKPAEHRPVLSVVPSPPPVPRESNTGNAASWRQLYHATADDLMRVHRITLAQALPRAYERMVSEWYLRHAQPDEAHCAGCGERIDDEQTIHIFMTGDRVHLADDLDCWLKFGRLWWTKAEAGSAALGIHKPDGIAE
jgi:hypothetical protein